MNQADNKRVIMKTKRIYQKYVIFYAVVLTGLMAVSGYTQAAHVKPVKGDHWMGTWASSAQEVESKLMPSDFQKLDDTTLRQVVRVSVGGERLRVRFSNAFADWQDNLKISEACIAPSSGGNVIKPETIKRLTFSGNASVMIPYGTLFVSDPVDFDLKPGSDLAITIHVSKASKKTTGHRSARGEAAFIQSGNAVTENVLPASVPNTCWYYLCGVDVLTAEPGAAIVCLGDSITDGKGSTEGQNRRWPDYLARRLQANPKTANIGVLNQGIGGNCLWSGGIGQPVIQRLERDVLAQTAARWVVVLEGINDLGGGRTSAEDIITSLQQVISRSQACGLLVYGSTILPCGESFYFNEELETKRQKINNWIRSSGSFDAVIDWDAVVRDPQKPSKLRPEADSGDHLHLSDEGYRMLAEAVNLKLFSQ
jgi:lysophospholipase L1-like esterase